MGCRNEDSDPRITTLAEGGRIAAVFEARRSCHTKQKAIGQPVGTHREERTQYLQEDEAVPSKQAGSNLGCTLHIRDNPISSVEASVLLGKCKELGDHCWSNGLYLGWHCCLPALLISATPRMGASHLF